MAKKEAGLNFNTVGWQEASHQVHVIAENVEKKYALAFTASVAKELQRQMKGRIRRGDKMSRRYAKWPIPAFKAIQTKKLKKKAKIKHNDIGHRVGLWGKMWAARGAWLERGHVTANGGRTRAYEWVKPSRDDVKPRIPALGNAGIVKKIKRDAKNAAKKIAASKKP